MSQRLKIGNADLYLVILSLWALSSCAASATYEQNKTTLQKSESEIAYLDIRGVSRDCDQFKLETNCTVAEILFRSATEGIFHKAGFCMTDSDCDMIDEGYKCLSVGPMPISSKELARVKHVIDALADFYCRRCSSSIILEKPVTDRLRCVSHQCVFDLRGLKDD